MVGSSKLACYFVSLILELNFSTPNIAIDKTCLLVPFTCATFWPSFVPERVWSLLDPELTRISVFDLAAAC